MGPPVTDDKRLTQSFKVNQSEIPQTMILLFQSSLWR